MVVTPSDDVSRVPKAVLESEVVTADARAAELGNEFALKLPTTLKLAVAENDSRRREAEFTVETLKSLTSSDAPMVAT